MFGRSDNQVQPDSEIFVIFDSKARAYERPLFETNEETLRRQIFNMFTDPRQAQNVLLVNAEDYSVFKVGSWSKTTGEITACKPTHVLNLHDLRAAIPPRPAQQMPELMKPGH